MFEWAAILGNPVLGYSETGIRSTRTSCHTLLGQKGKQRGKRRRCHMGSLIGVTWVSFPVTIFDFYFETRFGYGSWKLVLDTASIDNIRRAGKTLKNSRFGLRLQGSGTIQRKGIRKVEKARPSKALTAAAETTVQRPPIQASRPAVRSARRRSRSQSAAGDTIARDAQKLPAEEKLGI